MLFCKRNKFQLYLLLPSNRRLCLFRKLTFIWLIHSQHFSAKNHRPKMTLFIAPSVFDLQLFLQELDLFEQLPLVDLRVIAPCTIIYKEQLERGEVHFSPQALNFPDAMKKHYKKRKKIQQKEPKLLGPNLIPKGGIQILNP